MKLVLGVTMVMLFASLTATGQFRSQIEQEERVSSGMIQSSPTSFFGWFNPDKFHMRHSLSFSYLTMGGQGVSLGTYTNSMMYEIAENLQARADVSMSYSPNSSISQFGGQKASNLSSLYLSRAEISYKPWDNVLVQVQFRQQPYGYYSPFGSSFGSSFGTSFGSSFGSPWYGEDRF
jgi:hypothetical protein